MPKARSRRCRARPSQAVVNRATVSRPARSSEISAPALKSATRTAPTAAIARDAVMSEPPGSTSRTHSATASSAKQSIRSWKIQPPKYTASRTRGPRTSAERNRVRRSPDLPGPDGAIAPVALVEFSDCIFQVALREVGPQRIDEDQFGISRLPQQEIADPLFPASPDEQVGIGNVARQQTGREAFLGDVFGAQPPFQGVAHHLAGGVRDFLARAIAERDDQIEFGIAAGQLLGLLDHGHDIAGQLGAVADHPQAHAVLVQLRDFAAQVEAQQLHEVENLTFRPPPILRRKTEHGEIWDAQFTGSLYGAANSLDTLPLAGGARQAASLRPPAI